MALPPVRPIAPAGVFPFGAHVHREPGADPATVIADFPKLRDAGFTMIKIQGHWVFDEPAPGKLAVERTEALVAGAADAGLGVFLGLTMEQAPAWLWRRFPDAYQVDSHGLPHDDPTQYTLPADGKPGPCPHHPGVRDAAADFIRRYVAHFAQHDHIWVWNTWQEIGFWHNEAGELGFCYCAHTRAEFRVWLRSRYGDLDRLNAAWRTSYTDWADVEPPRRYTASPAFLDWRTFMDDVTVSGKLTDRRRQIRAADPAHRPVFGHLGDIEPGSTKAWRYAATGDLFGVSAYPAWHPFRDWDDEAVGEPTAYGTKLFELWDRILMQFDLLRSAAGPGRPGWGAEFQGGPINDFLHLGRTPEPADLRRWVLGALACGTNGICFWNLRSEPFWQEAHGFGLLDAEGDTTPRFAEAARLSRALSRHARLFAEGTPPPAEVAIVVSERQHHFAQGSAGAQAMSYHEGSVRGHYRRLAEAGIAVDFVDAEAGGDLSGYRVVLVSCPMLVSNALAGRLAGYAENGGTLIVEAPAGWVDGDGFARTGETFPGADRLFGARASGVRVVDEPGPRRWTPKPRGWGEFHEPAEATGADGTSVALAGLVQEWELRAPGAEPLLMLGSAVVGVRNPVGAGTAIAVGTVLGLTGTAYRHRPSDNFFLGLLAGAGVTASGVPGVGLRERVLDGERATFVINLRAEPVQVVVRVPAATRTADLLDQPLTADGDGVRLTVGSLDVRCLVSDRPDAQAGPAQVRAYG